MHGGLLRSSARQKSAKLTALLSLRGSLPDPHGQKLKVKKFLIYQAITMPPSTLNTCPVI